jgi:hypothetical protein
LQEQEICRIPRSCVQQPGPFALITDVSCRIRVFPSTSRHSPCFLSRELDSLTLLILNYKRCSLSLPIASSCISFCLHLQALGTERTAAQKSRQSTKPFLQSSDLGLPRQESVHCAPSPVSGEGGGGLWRTATEYTQNGDCRFLVYIPS